MGIMDPSYRKMVWRRSRFKQPRSTWNLFLAQRQLGRISFEHDRSHSDIYTYPEAECEYGGAHVRFEKMKLLSYKIEVTNIESKEQIAIITPSQVSPKAEIEFQNGRKYLAIKTMPVNMVEIVDGEDRRLCNVVVQYVHDNVRMSFSDVYQFTAIDIKPSDPDPLLFSIIGFYLHRKLKG